MLHQTPAIVLNTIKYGDTSLILHLYTELFGYQTYMLKGIRKVNKSGGSTSHLLLPGNILDTVVQHQNQKNFQVIKEFHLRYVYQNTYKQITKNSLLIFIIELLAKCTQEPESHPEVFYLTEQILQHIDQQPLPEILLTPQWYGLQLMSLLGFGVDDNHQPTTPYFNMREGSFTNTFNDEQGSCSMQISRLIHDLVTEPLGHLQSIDCTANHRKELLDKILQYIQIHLPNVPTLKSLGVVQSVMASV